MSKRGWQYPALILLLLGPCVTAQTAPSDDPAYEGLRAAVRSLQASKVFPEAKRHEATSAAGTDLEEKQNVVSDPPVYRAISQLREWLEKPVAPTASVAESITLFTQADDLIEALRFQQIVSLAAGRVAEAIDSARDGLRLAYAIQSDSLAAYEIGLEMERRSVAQLAQHLDEMAEKDCERLQTLARDWERSLDLIAFVLDREGKRRLAALQEVANQQGKGLQALLTRYGKAPGRVAELVSQTQKVPPAGQMPLFARATVALNRLFGGLQQSVRQPYWKLGESAHEAAPASELGEKIAEMLLPDSSALNENVSRRRAYARLLGCYAAIRRYRWEHDRLPGSLTVLQLGEKAIDPFSGQEFVYKVKKTRFTLESIGPLRASLIGTGEQKRASLSLIPVRQEP